MNTATGRALVAEFVGSAMLLAIIVGSGVMGERLAEGNLAIALLANSCATGFGLFVLIVVFAPLSGAEFNPVVTVINAVDRRSSVVMSISTVVAQVLGAIAGVWVAHAMFSLPVLAESERVRGGAGQILSEAVATFGLVLTIIGVRARGEVVTGAVVGAYIAAAYWYTASTSFANPAVTIARSLTPTFAGISPASAPSFVLAQCLGGATAYGFARMMGLGFQHLHSEDA